jgi:hypothetical protein
MLLKSTNNYEVTIKEHGNHDMEVTQKDKLDFALAIINSYQQNLGNEIHNKFKGKFKLSKNCTARFIISNYNESLLHIYPSIKKKVIIEYIDKPVQMMLSQGLINLNRPFENIYPNRISVNCNKNKAKDIYSEMESNLSVGGGKKRDSAYITTKSIVLNNFCKIFNFEVDSDCFMTLYPKTININLKRDIWGNPAKYNFALQGPLILTRQKNTRQICSNLL